MMAETNNKELLIQLKNVLMAVNGAAYENQLSPDDVRMITLGLQDTLNLVQGQVKKTEPAREL